MLREVGALDDVEVPLCVVLRARSDAVGVGCLGCVRLTHALLSLTQTHREFEPKKIHRLGSWQKAANSLEKPKVKFDWAG